MNTRNIVVLLLLSSLGLFAQKNIEKQLSDSLTLIAAQYASVGRITVQSVDVNIAENTLTVNTSEAFSQIPFRPESVKRIYDMIGRLTLSQYPDFKLICTADKKAIEEYIPLFYQMGNKDKSRFFDTKYNGKPFISNLSKPYQPAAGLYNKHIALWQSHGLYFNQSQKKWLWQRAKLFHTVEDLYTQSYILPFLVPMLENAGANVFLPRERDTNINELIIDNDNVDSPHRYRENTDIKVWKSFEPGFAYTKNELLQGENPFVSGTFRQIQSIGNIEEQSTAEWIPNVPVSGKYAVYVSFKSFKNSAPDARYTVFHRGGRTDFKVNQTMGGGTWIYLGHFQFDKGKNNTAKVVLSNYSAFDKKIITADAVKIGGGLGNIARSPNKNGILPNQKSSDTTSVKPVQVVETDFSPITSNQPRFVEAARYWLQWAGMPDSIYSKSNGKNDYTDDYQSRGFWVNYLAGGSSVLPNRQGLNIPLDLAFAFHTDAGTTINDSIIGTLGICTVLNSLGNTTFDNGVSRWASRDLTDLIQSQIIQDVRRLYAPEFTRRGLWNKNYSESRTPEVPTMLLELLSHQNFADMRYGLDPRFRFTVSRAIYKGILRFLYSNSADYVVQPLPVSHFSTRFVERNKLQLQWKAVIDSLEPTAKPDKYIVYTRIDDGDFDNGQVVTDTKFSVSVQSGKIYSFKITALNKGGESFPSEILSACRVNNSRKEVLIVNGFDRISAPGSYDKGKLNAGFVFDEDAGVPYINDYSFIGKQFDFDRTKPWKTDENPGFGDSYTNYAGKVIAGNTFDYPYVHGISIKAAGYSFVSSSLGSVIEKQINIQNYATLDLILGKQGRTTIGNAKKEPEFKTFPLALQKIIGDYCQKGGNVFVSGSKIGSDFYTNGYIPVSEKIFLENVLKIKYKSGDASFSSKINTVPSPYYQFGRIEFDYYNEPNATMIFAEKVDAIEPNGEGTFTICRYKGTNAGAGVAYSGKYKLCAFGFPIETIKNEKDRNKLIHEIMHFFETKNKRILAY